MDNFVKLLLQTSLSMSIVIILFIILTSLMLKIYNVKAFYYCCIVILLGLVIPFRFANIKLININIPNKINITNNTNTINNPNVDKNLGLNDNNYDIGISENKLNNFNLDISLYSYIFIVWISVFILIILKSIIKHIILLHTINRWSYDIKDVEALNILDDIKNEFKINKDISLKKCNIITSPLGLGFFNPMIIIPESEFDSEELFLFIKHELVHYKRKDLLYKSFVLFVCAIHWFNPIVYFMSRYIDMLCETSCDEEVMKNENIQVRMKYVECIINIVRNKSSFVTKFSTNFINGKVTLKRRIHDIMNMKKRKSNFISIFLLLVFMIFTSNIMVFGKDYNSYSYDYEEYWENMWEDLENQKEDWKNQLKDLENQRKDWENQLKDLENQRKDWENQQKDWENQLKDLNNQSKYWEDAKKGKSHKPWRDSLAKNMEPFKKYGVTYDKEKDRIFYNGKEVKAFIDAKSENWFMVRVYYGDVDSSIYLKSIRDDNSNIIGVTYMDKDEINELEEFYDFDDVSKDEEIDYSKNKIKSFTKDATTYINGQSIKASDKAKKNDIPIQVKNWIEKCDEKKGAYVYKTINDDKVNMWIYYNNGGSYPWDINYTNGTIEFYLYDMNEINGNEGYTLINCESINKKDNVKLYFEDVYIPFE